MKFCQIICYFWGDWNQLMNIHINFWSCTFTITGQVQVMIVLATTLFSPQLFFINILSNDIMRRTQNVVICCDWLREWLFVFFEQRKCSLPPFGILLLLSELLKPLLGRTRPRGRCWAAFRLSHRPEPSGHAVHGEVDGLDIGGRHGRRFVLLRHTHRPQRGDTPFAQAGAETSDTGAEAIKPDLSSSWQGHSGVSTGVGDENAESCGAVHPLRIPLVIRPLRRTYVVVR